MSGRTPEGDLEPPRLGDGGIEVSSASFGAMLRDAYVGMMSGRLLKMPAVAHAGDLEELEMTLCSFRPSDPEGPAPRSPAFFTTPAESVDAAEPADAAKPVGLWAAAVMYEPIMAHSIEASLAAHRIYPLIDALRAETRLLASGTAQVCSWCAS